MRSAAEWQTCSEPAVAVSLEVEDWQVGGAESGFGHGQCPERRSVWGLQLDGPGLVDLKLND